ncbi:VOC family protein [Tessaracoccus sp. OS52]|uniref:VOC family protein n=1 Tax=Tessaracoccus sp. OS52 TaxID=2886691 RepID=UPI001D12633B|nr:VOC family protein [Tessaracoccus sp. OS52]MCC2593962.1 VOC family protein [Tessaracoccus sp. OS52]
MSQLDHIVIAGPDLAALAAEFHRLTGVAPVSGGQHEGRGTANHLVGLGEVRYLELIGPDPTQDEPAQPRPLRVDEVTGTTVVGWAVRPDDIDAQVASARSVGYDPGDPAAMSRTTPSGDVLAWRLTSPSGGLDGAIPFLIDWQDSAHPSGGLPEVTLRSFTITHPDTDGVRAALAAVGALGPVSAIRRGDAVGLAVELDTPNGRVRIG